MIDDAPKHPRRIVEATEYGEIAGREYQLLVDQRCDPEQWDEDAQGKWCALLREIRVNPYEPWEYPHSDATPEQNAVYAKNWQHAFDQARHATQAENRRRIS